MLFRIIIFLLAAIVITRLWRMLQRELARGRVIEDVKRTSTKTRDPWETLGIKRDASESEVKAAYHRSMRDYHPDKVAHLGADLRELAEKRSVEINQAYEKIQREKGWSS